MNKLISIIIPTLKINKFIKNKIIKSLQKQTYKNYELIFVKGKLSPGEKRNKGVKKSKGEILAFIDDDVYPANKDWLKNALQFFKDPKIAAVSGPALTPPKSPLKQKASGLILSSWIGAAGAGTYRNQKEKIKKVDDYPTFNFFVRKSDFLKTGGFDHNFWPGEDTKLCYDLVYKLGKEIIYTPSVVVYHQRRPLFLPFLTQISRYGQQRGCFVRLFPKSSLKIGYFLPSFFLIFIIGGILSLLFPVSFLHFLYFLILLFYFILIIFETFKVYQKEKNFLLIIYFILGIFLTHIVYGSSFLYGLTGKPRLIKPLLAPSS